MPSFADLGLSQPLLDALQHLGYESPTPIQEQAIPPVLEGRDLAHENFGHAGIRSQAPVVVLRSKLAYAPCSRVTGGCDKSRTLTHEPEETPFRPHRT